VRDRYPYITKRIPHLECRACVALPRKSRWCACGRYVHYLPTVHPKCPHEVQDFNFQPLSYTAVSTHTHPAYIIVISCVKLKACMYMCTHQDFRSSGFQFPAIKLHSCIYAHTSSVHHSNILCQIEGMYVHVYTPQVTHASLSSAAPVDTCGQYVYL
jgi:hypothetical protein